MIGPPVDVNPHAPPPVEREFDFSDWQASNPNSPLPGADVDEEFDRSNAGINLLGERLALIQRDDGSLALGIVDVENLHADLVALLTGGQGVLPPPAIENAGKALTVNDSGTDYDFTEVMLYTGGAWDVENQRLSNVGAPVDGSDAATKQYVDDVLAGEAPGLSPTTGDIKATIKTVADAGWVLLNDGSIGNAASGATTRANADTEALFTLIWNNIANSYCPLQNSAGVATGRGASAAADYAANRRLMLPLGQGRVLAGSTGLLPLGSYRGSETTAIATANLPAHSHTGTTGGVSVNHTHAFTTGVENSGHSHVASPSLVTDVQGSHQHAVTVVGGEGGTFGGAASTAVPSASLPTSTDGAHAHNVTGSIAIGGASSPHTHSGNTAGVSADHTHNFTSGNTGSGTPVLTVPPTLYVNWQMKL